LEKIEDVVAYSLCLRISAHCFIKVQTILSYLLKILMIWFLVLLIKKIHIPQIELKIDFMENTLIKSLMLLPNEYAF